MLTDNWQIQLTIDICGALLLTTEKRPDGPKNKDVDSFCPIKVRFLLRISRSTQKCHISLIIIAWTIHIKALCHISVIWYLKPNSIVNLRDDRILKAVVSFHRIDSETIFECHRSRLPINDVNTVLALKKAPCLFLGLKELSSKYGLGDFDVELYHMATFQFICSLSDDLLSNILTG